MDFWNLQKPTNKLKKLEIWEKIRYRYNMAFNEKFKEKDPKKFDILMLNNVLKWKKNTQKGPLNFKKVKKYKEALHG